MEKCPVQNKHYFLELLDTFLEFFLAHLHLRRAMGKQTLRSLSLSYQKKDWRGQYDTDYII